MNWDQITGDWKQFKGQAIEVNFQLSPRGDLVKKMLPQFEELMRELYYLNADGLRIYLGAYNEDDPNYPGMMTVVFVPTYLNEATGKHADIVIDNDAEFESRCSASTEGVSKNYDTIGLCPPACGNHDFAYPLPNSQ